MLSEIGESRDPGDHRVFLLGRDEPAKGEVENQKVSYETEPDKRGKGPKAVNLEAAD